MKKIKSTAVERDDVDAVPLVEVLLGEPARLLLTAAAGTIDGCAVTVPAAFDANAVAVDKRIVSPLTTTAAPPDMTLSVWPLKVIREPSRTVAVEEAPSKTM